MMGGFFDGEKMKLKVLKPRLQTIKTNTPTAGKSTWRTSGRNSDGYGYKWQKARERYLLENPLCVYCERNGKTVVATVVDHIVPHRGDMRIFWDKSQWQALCSPCHSSVKQREEKQQYLY